MFTASALFPSQLFIFSKRNMWAAVRESYKLLCGMPASLCSFLHFFIWKVTISYFSRATCHSVLCIGSLIRKNNVCFIKPPGHWHGVGHWHLFIFVPFDFTWKVAISYFFFGSYHAASYI